MKNAKGTEPDSEKFKERSKTNTIQYCSTEQAVQHMLNAGMDKQLLQQNMQSSYEIDRTEVDSKSISTNNYRDEKIDIVDKGRRASQKIEDEIRDRQQKQRDQRARKNS